MIHFLGSFLDIHNHAKQTKTNRIKANEPLSNIYKRLNEKMAWYVRGQLCAISQCGLTQSCGNLDVTIGNILTETNGHRKQCNVWTCNVTYCNSTFYSPF